MSDEPSDAKKLIAQTMRAHRSYYNHGDQYDRCTGCNWKGCGPDEHEAHLAAEVDKALGGLNMVTYPKGRHIRWLSGVTEVSGGTVTE
ncbi:hypothetical protein P5V21_02580 [Mycobacteroides abscessus subsp. abscessus]|uniref:hypothetical protein n=1 Tax=Mycobacteroides abscessus TaxID=36809 RepID=UPI00266DA02C|nr:hypothetical protein [Mycobacteroides abscessus]MDO3096778.1 hypothetical protein [Mycobacteroides abscessus subsp. abscessus]